jgi:hypothetical protein
MGACLVVLSAIAPGCGRLRYAPVDATVADAPTDAPIDAPIDVPDVAPDAATPPVLAPVERWAATLGGPQSQELAAVAFGLDGAIAVGGRASPSSVDVGGGVLPSGGGLWDSMLALHEPSGTLRWIRLELGAGEDKIADVAVGASGQVYACGRAEGELFFDGMPGPIAMAGSDGFVASFDRDGALRWVYVLTGPTTESIFGLSIDGDGNVWFAGWVEDGVVLGDAPVTSAGGQDIVWGALDDGGSLVRSGIWGGANGQQGQKVAASGEIIAVVGMSSGDLTLPAGSISAPPGASHAYASLIDRAGAPLGLFTFGGTAFSWFSSVDHVGGVLALGGSFEGSARSPTPALDLDARGGGDGVVFFDGPTGTWAKRIGSSGDDEVLGVAVLPGSYVAAVGLYRHDAVAPGVIGSTEIPPSADGTDGFVAVFDPSSELVWHRFVGGSARDVLFDVSAGPDGRFAVVGHVDSPVDFAGASITPDGRDAVLLVWDTR